MALVPGMAVFLAIVTGRTSASGTAAQIKYSASGWGIDPSSTGKTITVSDKRPVREHDDDDQEIDRAAALNSPCLILRNASDTFLYLLSAEKYAVDNC